MLTGVECPCQLYLLDNNDRSWLPFTDRIKTLQVAPSAGNTAQSSSMMQPKQTNKWCALNWPPFLIMFWCAVACRYLKNTLRLEFPSDPTGGVRQTAEQQRAAALEARHSQQRYAQASAAYRQVQASLDTLAQVFGDSIRRVQRLVESTKDAKANDPTAGAHRKIVLQSRPCWSLYSRSKD